MGILATQRDSINASVNSLNRLAGTFAGQQDVLSRALERIPPALDVLIAERPTLTTALEKLGDFSVVATGLVNDTRADLVRDLRNLEPTLRALADVGPELDRALAYFTAFPYGQATIDRAIRGDYLNQYIVFDFTIPRLKRTLFLGTSWGQEGAKLVPAPGDPWYATYTYDPLNAPFSAPPAAVAPIPAHGSGSEGRQLMLTRFVRTQLAIFTVASIVGIAAMAMVYLQLPTLLGIGRMTVTLELPRTGGLYRFANVTYRGVQIAR